MSHVSKTELKDIILGGQDGLVNVLGLSLGLYATHATSHIIVVAGLAAGFSEAVSMAAVAYTSSLSDKLRMAHVHRSQILYGAFIVGISALIGALIPVVPFIFFNANISITTAVIFAGIILFIFGVFQAKSTHGSWWRSDLQILLIGIISAFVGFFVGLILKVQ